MSECTPSLSMAELPVTAAATNFVAVTATLPSSAAYTTRCAAAGEVSVVELDMSDSPVHRGSGARRGRVALTRLRATVSLLAPQAAPRNRVIHTGKDLDDRREGRSRTPAAGRSGLGDG